MGGYSAAGIKKLMLDITLILKVVLIMYLTYQWVPQQFLQSYFFFIHKQGSQSDNNNYRFICIQNPTLKILNKVVMITSSSMWKILLFYLKHK